VYFVAKVWCGNLKRGFRFRCVSLKSEFVMVPVCSVDRAFSRKSVFVCLQRLMRMIRIQASLQHSVVPVSGASPVVKKAVVVPKK